MNPQPRIKKLVLAMSKPSGENRLNTYTCIAVYKGENIYTPDLAVRIKRTDRTWSGININDCTGWFSALR